MKITAFADETHWCWDHDAGLPTALHFGNAVQVWSIAQDRPMTVNDAALVFNVSPDLVYHAVDEHPWLYLEAGDVIGHDGE